MTRQEMIVQLLGLGDVSVDDEGRVWRHGVRHGKTFSPYPVPRRIDHKSPIGYWVVKLGWFGVRFGTSAHRMQWIKHHGPIPEGLEVNHMDRNPSNNRLDNLELLTHKANYEHAVNNGGRWLDEFKREKHSAAKLNWEQVRYIRAEVGSGRATQAAMAEKFGVNPVTISLIMSGKNWKE